MNNLKGTGVAIVTCFTQDHSIDYVGLEKLIDHVIQGGVDYLVLLGTTAESVTLEKEEKHSIVKFIKGINRGRLPIVLGVGGNNTKNVIIELELTDFEGVDAILSVSPYYNKPSQEGIYQHYKLISEASPVPLILYNVPSRTGVNISSDTTLKLANDFKNIVAIKEASGNLDQIMQVIQNKPKDFIVLSGDDALTLPMIYMGAEGVISVIGQSHPVEFSTMVRKAMSNCILEANSLHYELYDLYRPLYEEGNPTGIKAALEVLGICQRFVRPPLMKASNKIMNKLTDLLHNN